MARHFNTGGPCNPIDHYMLPPDRRLPELRDVINQKAYFVLHAPRQVGKTTTLMALAHALTAEGRYAAAALSVEVGASRGDDLSAAENAILGAWRGAAESLLPRELHPPQWPEAEAGARLFDALRAWTTHCPRPLVVFIDEIDALHGDTLRAVLSQLRDGHRLRPAGFPWALALVGLRDVRDYKLAPGGLDATHSSSPFNIKVESFTMRNFTLDEVGELYAQHTNDSGQRFDGCAVARAFELTQGQPWLVNALARQLIEVLVTDRTKVVTADKVDHAKENLIQRQDTHLDSLAERLKEPRVRQIIAPMLAGGSLGDVPDDDRRFALDLGLVRRSSEGGLEVANPIYREVLPRALAQGVQDSLPRIAATWLTPDGSIDAERLLSAFVAFWREHGDALLGSAPYPEVASQLVMMAFLHRVVNGGGSIEREYALGSGRIDLCVKFRDQRLAIELKVWRSRQRDPEAQGLAQLDAYLDALGLDTGWLVIFDQRKGRPPPSKRYRTARRETPSSRAVTLVRM